MWSAHFFVIHIQTEKISSWNGPTVHVCWFMLARASTKIFVSRVRKTAEKNLLYPKNSLAGSLVSRGITVTWFCYVSMLLPLCLQLKCVRRGTYWGRGRGSTLRGRRRCCTFWVSTRNLTFHSSWSFSAHSKTWRDSVSLHRVNDWYISGGCGILQGLGLRPFVLRLLCY